MELLLSVVDTFMLTGRGLAFWPDFPLLHGKHNAACAVIVERPNGSRLPAEAQLRLDHFLQWLSRRPLSPDRCPRS